MEPSEQLIQHKLRQLENEPVRWNKHATWQRLEKPSKRRVFFFYYAAAVLVIGVSSWGWYSRTNFNNAALRDRIAELEARVAQANDQPTLAADDGDRMCVPEVDAQPPKVERAKPRAIPSRPVLVANELKPATDSTQWTIVALQPEEPPTETQPIPTVEQPAIPIILGRSQGAAYARSKRFSFRLILSDPGLTEQPITVSEADIVAGIKQKPN